MTETGKKEIKLIVSEIDGVITDGKCAEDEIGNVLYKVFQNKDFAALNEIKKSFKFVFMSDDNRVSYNLCRRRNIPFYWARSEQEKYSTLIEIMRRYECTPDEVLYIGSKISDVKCCRLIPRSFCPDDAGQYLKEVCWASFLSAGGCGILVELLYLLKIESKNSRIFE